MDVFVLSLFVVMLFLCIIFEVPILYALFAGYVIFALYALKKGFSFRDVMKMSFEGIKTVKNVLITFMLIGILTALWRGGGTVAAIVCYSSGLMVPMLFFAFTFVMNCAVSFLTGTAFGTAATMGAVCMTMANMMGYSPVMAGGAILAGAYFGDRCSPVSTSALLVAEITKTDIYKNIKNMLTTAAIPFAVSVLAYALYGILFQKESSASVDVYAMFSGEFDITPIAVIPAVVILVMALFKVNVKISMLSSIAVSVPICIFCQKAEFVDIIKTAIFGFEATDEALSSIINGGGVLSMLKVAMIVCVSSCYSGIFKKTGLLSSVQNVIVRLGKHLSDYAVILITSIVTGCFACNQTLTVMMTHQICSGLEEDKEKLALYLENSAIVIAPLIPWSIAGSVPLTSVGAPTLSVIAAIFLVILPIHSLLIFRKKNSERK